MPHAQYCSLNLLNLFMTNLESRHLRFTVGSSFIVAL